MQVFKENKSWILDKESQLKEVNVHKQTCLLEAGKNSRKDIFKLTENAVTNCYPKALNDHSGLFQPRSSWLYTHYLCFRESKQHVNTISEQEKLLQLFK